MTGFVCEPNIMIVALGLHFIMYLALVYAIEVEEYYNARMNTEQRAAEKAYNQVADVRFIVFAIGVCQILEGYAKVSVSVQDMKLHPSSVPQILEELCDSLEKMSQSWYWEQNKLNMAGIGCPYDLVKEIKVSHTSLKYKCTVNKI